ncbi:MAG TPA: hypothetical protein VK179_21230 [Bacteroidales bacterium]|nr:hypothetical protein [Bacteroidales bacterium]
MKTARVIKILFILFVSGIFFIVVCFVGIYFWIRSDVNKYCDYAKSHYPGDNVEALIAELKSQNSSLEEKNHVIWTLEYVGDDRALSTLKSLQTGTPCDHSKYVCQRELLRAIGNIEGTNTALIRFK